MGYIAVISWIFVVISVPSFMANRNLSAELEKKKKLACQKIENALSHLKSKNQDFEYRNLVDFIYRDFSESIQNKN
jgi:hypothetical protein